MVQGGYIHTMIIMRKDRKGGCRSVGYGGGASRTTDLDGCRELFELGDFGEGFLEGGLVTGHDYEYTVKMTLMDGDET